MSDCKTFEFGGLGECTALRGSVQAMIPMKKGTTITSANAAIIGVDSTGWASILAPLIATSTYEKGTLIDFNRGYEVTTDEAEMTPSGTGFEEQTSTPKPKMTAYGKMSYSEYQSFFRAHGHTFDFALISDSGNPILTKTTTVGTYKGFRGRLFVDKGSIPKSGADLQKECVFKVFFDDAEEWEKIVEVESEFTFTNLIDICPVGLDAKVTLAYATPNVTIKVTKRATDTPYDGVATAANIQIISSINDVACVVATVAQTNKAVGSYIVALTAALNGPVWARITAESGSRTYASKMFEIVE